MNEKWASRKVVLTSISLLIITTLPIVYKHLEISDEVTLLVIGAVATASGVYNAFNSLSKKYMSETDDKPASN